VSTRPESNTPRVGLALAGGGPEGAVYEIGALRALDEALEGLDLNDLDVYVGVSAGAFIGACLANDLTPEQMCRAIVKHEPGEHPFKPETFLRPNLGEWARRLATVPELLWEAVRDTVRRPGDASLAGSLTRLARALPVGLFDNEPLRVYLEKIYSIKGRTDDFRQLRKPLVVVAADLDSGQAVRFGEPPFDAVPISVAVQASTALPGLYPPVQIGGRFYVDGVLLKTLHASVALERGVKLLFCVNPIVPVDTVRAVEQGVMRTGQLVSRGLPTVLSQTFRTMIHSRLEAGMAAYERRFAGADIVMLQPRRDDYRMFFTSIFSFSSRRAVAQHAYDATREELRRRYDELSPVLARHGIGIRRDVLDDEGRDLWEHLAPARAHGGLATERLASLLDGLDRLLPELERHPPETEPAATAAAGVEA
jgi:predicted acylesterase/phospholipase RssA